jgi:sulfide:quinone oxidoreductase
MADSHLVICGGGIAGIEALLRLRRLVGDGVRVTLLSPASEFAYRPLSVLEPFAADSIRRYPLERIAFDTDAHWIMDRLSRVDTSGCKVHTDGGREFSYDALLLALGAEECSPFEHAHLFTDRDAGQSFRGIVQEIELGDVRAVAFVVPNWPVWPVPLYELALMTAERVRRLDLHAQITLITPEPRPLKGFGQAAGDATLRLLAQAGITLYTGVIPQVPAPQLVTFGESRVETQRIVTLPKVSGPGVQGIPAGTAWFVPIDERCHVRGAGGQVFAAGDATDFPVKHGGIAAQQADTAAAGIAHLLGVGERPEPLRPVICGKLLTGDRPLYMAARVIDGLGWHSHVHEQPPWPARQKVVADELGPYLATLDPVNTSPGGSL